MERSHACSSQAKSYIASQRPLRHYSTRHRPYEPSPPTSQHTMTYRKKRTLSDMVGNQTTLSSNNSGKMMKAVMWEGHPFSMAVRDVPRPTIQQPTDVIVRITTAAICGAWSTYPVLPQSGHADTDRSQAPISTPTTAYSADQTCPMSWDMRVSVSSTKSAPMSRNSRWAIASWFLTPSSYRPLQADLVEAGALAGTSLRISVVHKVRCWSVPRCVEES